jgi:hypothetical protein
MDINSFTSFCDDFFIEMYVNTELELPTQRDTVLTFFERIQKQYPEMGSFYRRSSGEVCLEEDRNQGRYRWISLEGDRVGSGYANPGDLGNAYEQDRLVLELVPYMLGVNHLDVDSIDVTFALDLTYVGNHDEVIAEALYGTTPFGSLSDYQDTRPIGCSPTMVMALSEDMFTQARISIESKTSVFEPTQKKSSQDDAITVSFTVRQYPVPNGRFDPLSSFERQCRLAEEWVAEKIIPDFVGPLGQTIAQRR